MVAPTEIPPPVFSASTINLKIKGTCTLRILEPIKKESVKTTRLFKAVHFWAKEK